MSTQPVKQEDGLEIEAIPPIEANTVRFEAGALTFGVEYRHLDTATARETLAREQALGRIPDLDVAAFEVEETEGVTIHVFGTEDRGEYLRFDCFRAEPHYHYMDPTIPWANRHTYDDRADGPMLDWTLERLRTRLPELLERTEAGARLAQQVDLDVVAKVLDVVESHARSLDGIG